MTFCSLTRLHHHVRNQNQKGHSSDAINPPVALAWRCFFKNRLTQLTSLQTHTQVMVDVLKGETETPTPPPSVQSGLNRLLSEQIPQGTRETAARLRLLKHWAQEGTAQRNNRKGDAVRVQRFKDVEASGHSCVDFGNASTPQDPRLGSSKGWSSPFYQDMSFLFPFLHTQCFI